MRRLQLTVVAVMLSAAFAVGVSGQTVLKSALHDFRLGDGGGGARGALVHRVPARG